MSNHMGKGLVKMMDFEQLAQSKIKALSETDRNILSFILNNQEKVAKMSIAEFEAAAYVSKATALRFAKKLGFSGFSEMKFFLKQSLEVQKGPEQENLISLQKEDIHQTLRFLQSVPFENLIQTMYQAETFYCYATGYYQRKALEEFYQLFLTFEKNIVVISDKTELELIMPKISVNDFIMMVSVSGETENVKEDLLSLRLRKIPILTVTVFNDNFFSRHADFQLYYYSTPVLIGERPAYRRTMIGLNIVLDFLVRKYGEYHNKRLE